MADNFRFKVLGPFPVPFVRLKSGGKRIINLSEARKSIFDQAEILCAPHFDIKRAVGLYVFGLSPSGSAKTRAYYVGQACKQTLYGRVFQLTDKKHLYEDILNWYSRATPFVYLLPLLTPTGRLAKLGAESSARKISLAEQDLIGMALRSNPDLWNIQHRVAMESFVIEGTPMHKGKKTFAAEGFRRMLDLSPPKKAVKLPGEPLESPDFIAVTEEDQQPVEVQPGGEVDVKPTELKASTEDWSSTTDSSA